MCFLELEIRPTEPSPYLSCLERLDFCWRKPLFWWPKNHSFVVQMYIGTPLRRRRDLDKRHPTLPVACEGPAWSLFTGWEQLIIFPGCLSTTWARGVWFLVQTSNTYPSHILISKVSHVEPILHEGWWWLLGDLGARMTPYMEFPEILDSKMGIIFIGKATFWGFSKVGNSDICKKLEGCTTAPSGSSQSGCTGTCQSVSGSEASPEANGTWGTLYWSTGGRRSRSSLIFYPLSTDWIPVMQCYPILSLEYVYNFLPKGGVGTLKPMALNIINCHEGCHTAPQNHRF